MKHDGPSESTQPYPPPQPRPVHTALPGLTTVESGDPTGHLRDRTGGIRNGGQPGYPLQYNPNGGEDVSSRSPACESGIYTFIEG